MSHTNHFLARMSVALKVEAQVESIQILADIMQVWSGDWAGSLCQQTIEKCSEWKKSNRKCIGVGHRAGGRQERPHQGKARSPGSASSLTSSWSRHCWHFALNSSFLESCSLHCRMFSASRGCHLPPGGELALDWEPQLGSAVSSLSLMSPVRF